MLNSRFGAGFSFGSAVVNLTKTKVYNNFFMKKNSDKLKIEKFF